jgi:hypothetical protein
VAGSPPHRQRRPGDWQAPPTLLPLLLRLLLHLLLLLLLPAAWAWAGAASRPLLAAMALLLLLSRRLAPPLPLLPVPPRALAPHPTSVAQAQSWLP